MPKPPAIIELFNRFIPAAIRNNRKLQREEMVRTQAMLAILGISLLVPLLLLAIFIALQAFTPHDFSRNINILIFTEIILMSQHIYFQSYGNLRVTAGIYSVQFLFIIIASVVVSGGLSSSLIILLICSPMIAFMTMGYRAALNHIAAVSITIVCLLVIQLKSFHLQNISHVDNIPYNQAAAWGVTLLIFYLFLNVFAELVRSTK